MKKLIWFGLSLVALSATPTFSAPSHPPVSYEEVTQSHSPSAPVLAEDFKTYYKKLFDQALHRPNGLSELLLAYETANASVKIDMDQYLLLPILQSLESDDARNTLTKLAPFF